MRRKKTTAVEHDEDHLALARLSLSSLLTDTRVPDEVREGLKHDYAEVEAMLDRLEHEHLHIAVFGRVSVGKSALLNALLGESRFETGVLHGQTRSADRTRWTEYEAGGVFLTDTPGINEVEGEERERLAHDVAGRSDLVLFVADGDLTGAELDALKAVCAVQRPVILVLNKTDRYTAGERQTLTQTLIQRTEGLVAPENVVTAAANPAPQVVLTRLSDGTEKESVRPRAPDVSALRERLWEIIESEGKTLIAMNASLFAGELSDRVGQKILLARREIGSGIIRLYCMGKGLAVALNPVPVSDLVAAAVIDVSMVAHLSKIYGLPMTRSEASRLVRAISGQMVILAGTIWAVHFASSALKLGSAGLSTVATAAAQGAVAWYGTLVVGNAAEAYLAAGKSWGDTGPKKVVQEILDTLDRDSILQSARSELMNRLRS